MGEWMSADFQYWSCAHQAKSRENDNTLNAISILLLSCVLLNIYLHLVEHRNKDITIPHTTAYVLFSFDGTARSLCDLFKG